MSDDFSEFNELIKNHGSANHDDLLAAITERVSFLLDSDIELLMSYLYRLDVLEVDIDFILNKQKDVPVNEGLGKLIFDRQMARQKYREQFKQKPIEGWDEW